MLFNVLFFNASDNPKNFGEEDENKEEVPGMRGARIAPPFQSSGPRACPIPAQGIALGSMIIMN
jgi:hypothetical protein